ncbi:MAG: calcium/sodium antiporter [candidate division WOR-3 bacterium]
MLTLFLLLVSFFPLIYGAHLLVDSASSLAKRLNVPTIAIGLTVIAFGTSTPELVVNIFASLGKVPKIALGNIVGSNIFNILCVLGFSSIVYPLTVKTNTTWIEIPLCLLSAIILLFLANDQIIDKTAFSLITRKDGLILLLFFLIFTIYNVQLMKSGSFTEEVPVKDYSLQKSILFIILGFILLIGGGKLTVLFAKRFAEEIGLSERIIAITIVSIGTSLPELATSVVAAMKKNVDISIGNIVGSNIFNTFFILGTSAIINPISFEKISNLDMVVNIFASILLFIFIFTGKGRRLDRWEGIIFIIIYIFYFIELFIL